MSSDLQTIDSIGPVAEESKDKKPANPVQAEYEEGKRFLENKEIGQAAVALHNALIGFEEMEDEPGVANASNQLGLVCIARQEYESALTHFKRTYEICDKSFDRMSTLSILKQYIVVYRGLKQYDKAINVCLDMLDRYQDNRDPQGTVFTLEIMVDIYIDAENSSKAADTLRTAASIHKNYKHESIAKKLIERAEELEKNS